MTDETRILRTVGIPIVIAVILLFVLPKMCARAVVVAKARQEQSARAAGGLHIESSQKPVSYPAGLDPERIRYLVEIDTQFSAPYMAGVSKTSASNVSPREQMLLGALEKLGYVDPGADNTLTLTRDGLLHLDGLVDDGTSWNFPVAKRRFVSVKSIDSDGSTAHAAFTWQWQPGSVGEVLIPAPKRHEAKVELLNAGGRWTLAQITDLDRDLE
jgi:hypothetical protein